MKRFALLFTAAAFAAACSSGDTGGEGASTQAAGMVGNMISYADVAGTWDVTATAVDSDSVLLTYTLTATADSTGWTVTFAGRDPLPLHVMAPSGDSIVTHLGPYESVLRPGVMTTTTSVTRIVDGKLVGTFTATYSGGGADSVLQGRAQGVRKE